MITKEFKKVNNIKIFDENIIDSHQDYNSKGLDVLYSQEEKHFWFISRKFFILQNFNKYIKKGSKIIEIGAGTGNVSRYLKENRYENISVGEMHLSGLKYAQSYGIKDCYQFNLLDSPFENEFDVVCMFDVLEHIENDMLALKNANKILKDDGYIALTVPAHMWLWNREDKILGHKIRYTKKDLEEKIRKNNFEIVSSRYFFISIVPLLFLRKFIKRDNKSEVSQDEHNYDISINPIINIILLFISNLENKINSYLPNFFGGSIFIIAKRNKQ